MGYLEIAVASSCQPQTCILVLFDSHYQLHGYCALSIPGTSEKLRRGTDVQGLRVGT